MFTFRGLMYDYPNFEGLITICTYMKVPPSQSAMLAADTTPWNEVQLSSFRKRLSVNHHISGRTISNTCEQNLLMISK